MKSRRSSRIAACASNLRQIGAMVLMYADSNNDLVPMGLTAIPKSGGDPLSPNTEWDTTPAWTCYLVVGGAPTCNLGALFGARLLSGENAKMLYCPADVDERLAWKLWQPKYPPRGAEMSTDLTLRVSYFGRSVSQIYRHTLLPKGKPQVLWPGPAIPRLDDFRNKALYAERNSHGNYADPRMNVLYQDGSVKYVMMKRGEGSGAGASAAGVYSTPDHLPPRPDADSEQGYTGSGVVTHFDWGYFDQQ
jgi:prepilin-type processing-associated H-X9-DG protein